MWILKGVLLLWKKNGTVECLGRCNNLKVSRVEELYKIYKVDIKSGTIYRMLALGTRLQILVVHGL
jgi:hypothetical protein